MSFTVKVQPSGLTFSVHEGQSVLDAALEAKVLLPYSCRNGTCSTCKGKIVEGVVEAGDAPANILEASEIQQGYTLLCQARAQSDLVIESPQAQVMSDIQVRKMPSRVIGIEQLRDDVAILKVQLPAANPLYYYAGQYLDFLLKDGLRRSYSMATPPNEDNVVELHIRHLPGGVFTDQVFGVGETQLKERAILRVEAPLGSFFLREESTKPIVMLASGTGFAPIKAIIEHMQQHDIQRDVVLYWGGRRPRDLYMSELAESWANTLPNFRFVPVISEALPDDNWTGRTGFVHHAVMHDLPDLSAYEVYACGAPIMVETARKDFVSQCHLPDEAFYADAFTSEADAI